MEEKKTTTPTIVMVTSPQHTGKSSLIARYVDLCRRHQIAVAGILAEGLWENNRRSGFNLVDLSSGIRVPLAFRRAEKARAKIAFEFYAQGMHAGKRALDTGRCATAALIVVDEVGKLEVMGQGWATCLPALIELPGKTHIWAVRSTLVESVAERWGFTPRAVVDARAPDALNQLIGACALFKG
ncbi:nucleoside-triphosphatase [Desulfosarcina ovata]|uniref:NTPase n=1 Tax=Desulfosarcina ovata subsp. ovata TaxID=2752305 RepID=A0A5K8AP75_9BACT|nr:nucleoside-triphosphatase [Desulfosarcina ovata]BBO93414.1 hypothetical protein DSCOOX_65940 [Desulfosarcina ovata subsp. ovata]